ncbi:MAG: hypothetical protein WCK47_05345 [bacterium]
MMKQSRQTAVKNMDELREVTYGPPTKRSYASEDAIVFDQPIHKESAPCYRH